MAKNLKLNIKNTQLAEALKLGKKVTSPRKVKEENFKAAEVAKPEVRNDSLPAVESPSPVAKTPSSSPVTESKAPIHSVKEVKEVREHLEQRPHQPIEERPREEHTPRSEFGPINREPRPHQPREELPREEHTPRSEFGPINREPRPFQPREERAPYTPREPRPFTQGESRPPYNQGSRPPYQQGSRPPYQQGARPPYQQGSRPPSQAGGARPPYQQGGARPPYQQGGARPPYQPGGARPPYQQGGARPPYQPGGAARPPFQPGGARPPFRPGGARPPFSPSGRPPFAPRAPQTGEPPKDFPKRTVSEPRKVGGKDFRDNKPQKKTLTGDRSFDARDRSGLSDTEGGGWRKKRPSFKSHIIQEEIIRPKTLKVRIPITVKDLASEMKLKASELVSKLFMQGVILTLNDFLTDETTIQLLGSEFGCDITIDTSQEERIRITDKSIKDEVQGSDPNHLQIRPPVVAFMGHVDHGKTSLIDAIRKTNTASGEAGAITQHIGAFKCHTAVGDLTILDTPGHEAFSAMRSRGADITDIVVLVVAGDEGIRAQTMEAIQQARAANVPIVVAINKCDKPNFNAENIYRQLADQELLPEAWGGATITINCSAVLGTGIKELLEMLALQAEVLELKANPSMRARGAVIESEMHKGFGAVATVLIQNGTLRIGDAVVFAQHFARIKTMQDENGKDLEIAPPSTPVKITGLSGLPLAGSDFIVVKSEREARELAEERSQGQRNISMLQKKKAGFENMLQQEASKGTKKILNLILRADVQGSLEALKNSLQKISSTKAELIIVSEAVGEVSESDIQLASASKATIIGFHTKIESHSDALIKQLKVTVRLHDIIYHAVDDVKELMRQLLDKIPQESDTGEALVKAVFKASQLGSIAGCQVMDGIIKRSSLVRLLREGKVIWKGTIATLKRVKEDVKEVSKGIECGILLNNYNEIKEEDIIQAYEITYLEQTL